MKISNEWLSDFIKTDLPVDKIAEILTDIGLEVEGTETTGLSKEDLDGFIVGKVVACTPHPNADKLKITQVDLGKPELVQIVCGAPNVGEGQNVPVATIGTILKDHKGNSFKIKKAKLRGEASHGMICSKKELQISEDNDGIWVMNPSLEPGTPLSEVIETKQDTVYEIGLTPNRADAMSHFGVARDLYAALASRKLNVSFEGINIQNIENSSLDSPIQVNIEENELCLRYTGICIKDIQVAESPKWLQDRLKAIGLSPINNIVDITNYVLHGLGQPMHVFDKDKIKGQKIIVQKAKANDSFTTLDGVERKLNGEELMICDSANYLSIAGVMGGIDSSVTKQTKNIFLESAYFSPINIRKTAKYHTINSDSSFRFERGIDPNISLKALQYAAKLITEIAGGAIEGSYIDTQAKPVNNFEVILKFRTLERLLGERIHREKIKEILELLDIKIITENTEMMELQIPPYRVDVQREVDVVEEILRIYGYNNIQVKEKLTTSIVNGNGFTKQNILSSLTQNLISKGFYEGINLSMYNQKYNDILDFNSVENISLINSLSKDLSVMRRSLLPGLLQNIEYNIKRKNTNVKLFEFGKSYKKLNSQYIETPTLSLIISGNQLSENWNEPSKEVNIYYLKGIVEQILTQLKANNYTTEELSTSYYQNAISYKINNTNFAHIAEVNSKTLTHFDIEQKVFYAEFNIDLLINHYVKNKGMKFKPLSKFPDVRRDLALLADQSISYEDIKLTIIKTDNKHIYSVNLFDVYEGNKLPNGKKSYAVSLTLRDKEKTMQDKQIDTIMKKVVSNLKKDLDVELRN